MKNSIATNMHILIKNTFKDKTKNKRRKILISPQKKILELVSNEKQQGKRKLVSSKIQFDMFSKGKF